MGCKASTEIRDTQIQPFVGASTAPADDLEDDPELENFAIGFNSKAQQRFAIDGHHDTLRHTADFSNDVAETDEFRVLRVSALSGQVTLYVAGGKHKKPVQYGNDRICPRASEQPVHCTKCPFCTGNEPNTPPNVLSFGKDGTEHAAGVECEQWALRVFPNIFPMLICPIVERLGATPELTSYYGKLYDEKLENLPHSVVARGVHSNVKVSRDIEDPTCVQVDAKGVSEVFVESTQHNALLALQDAKDIELLLQALTIRCRILSKETWVKQLLIFKQYGPLSGGSLVHPHTQVVSLPVLPPQLVSRLEFSTHIHEKHKRCATCLACVDPFIKEEYDSPDSPKSFASSRSCGLARSTSGGSSCGTPTSPGSPNSDKARSRLVHMTEHFVVSVPYASSSQYSMTIAPRRHSPSFLDMTPEEVKDLAFILALLSQAVYYGLDDPSYNCFIRSGPNVDSIQLGLREVSRRELNEICHWIMEFRPRFPADLGGFEIASGIRVVSGLPEDHAAELRGWVAERLQAGMVPVKTEERPASKLQRKTERNNSHEKVKSSKSNVARVTVGGNSSSWRMSDHGDLAPDRPA